MGVGRKAKRGKGNERRKKCRVELESVRPGELGSWRAGKLECWRAGGLEGWRAGGLESWRAGELESWRAGEKGNWTVRVVVFFVFEGGGRTQQKISGTRPSS
jgi:hypothetical protein